MLHFMRVGTIMAGMAGFKAHCALVILGDERQSEAMGQYGKIAAMADLPAEAELIAALQAAAERVQTWGTALKPRSPKVPKAENAMPGGFAAARAQVPVAQAAFASFAPSHRHEYLEWITTAKAEATRNNRIAQAVDWIAQGKKRNRKYENC